MFFVTFPCLKDKNSVQNININYVSLVWHIVLVLQTFLMCFTLTLGVKSCYIIVFFWLYSDCTLTVLWPYFDRTLIVFCVKHDFIVHACSHISKGINNMCITCFDGLIGTQKQFTCKSHAHFLAFSPLIKNWNVRLILVNGVVLTSQNAKFVGTSL